MMVPHWVLCSLKMSLQDDKGLCIHTECCQLDDSPLVQEASSVLLVLLELKEPLGWEVKRLYSVVCDEQWEKVQPTVLSVRLLQAVLGRLWWRHCGCISLSWPIIFAVLLSPMDDVIRHIFLILKSQCQVKTNQLVNWGGSVWIIQRRLSRRFISAQLSFSAWKQVLLLHLSPVPVWTRLVAWSHPGNSSYIPCH